MLTDKLVIFPLNRKEAKIPPVNRRKNFT